MTAISRVQTHLIENADQLAVDVVDKVLVTKNLVIPDWEKKLAVEMYSKFMVFLGKSIFCENHSVPDELVEWSKENANREASSGGDISEIISRYPPTRVVFNDLLTELSVKYGLTIEQHGFLTKRIHSILDVSINETLFAFERKRKEMIRKTQKEMAELSAPVVPLDDGIAILPLIGTIDSYRAAYLLEKVIPRIADLQLSYLIVDFSGLLLINEEMAQQLYQIENMLRLLGVNTFVTGIRPDLAQTVVKIGLDMSHIPTFSSVKQALQTINKQKTR